MSTATAVPVLTRGGVTWRVLLTLAISVVAWVELAIWQWQHERWWFWLDLALGIGGGVLTIWRRRFPLTVALLTNGFSVCSGSLGGPATLALFSLATRRRWREILPVGIVAVAASAVLVAQGPESENEVLVVTSTAIVAIVCVTIGWGMYVGSRRELLATLRLRADTAESEQAARVAQARIAERNRIAREMHDVLAHRISMVAMHAGALTYRDDLTVEQVRASAQIIQDSSHQALVDLREVLGILREDLGDLPPVLPQPGACDLHQLLADARRSGMRLDASIALDLEAVPAVAGRTLYRTVQEALTNARKHAPDTLVTLLVSGGPEAGIQVEVSNPQRVGTSPSDLPVSGLGLIGVRERVELAGGRLRTTTDRRSFGLHLWLPWPA